MPRVSGGRGLLVTWSVPAPTTAVGTGSDRDASSHGYRPQASGVHRTVLPLLFWALEIVTLSLDSPSSPLKKSS